jgi:hypothetical protein
MVEQGAERSKQQRAQHAASSAGTFGKPPAHLLLKSIQDVILKNWFLLRASTAQEDRGQPQSKTQRTKNSAKSAMPQFRTSWGGLISRLLPDLRTILDPAQDCFVISHSQQPRKPTDNSLFSQIRTRIMIHETTGSLLCRGG